ETELSRQMTTSTTSIDIMGLQAAYANLHTDQERDYFMQRYHDVISSFGGKTSYDADNRPLLVMRSNLWASGYDVDGTDQTSLGQFSGRVQQTYKHSVPSKEAKMGKVMRHTLGASLNIRHNLSSSKGPKPLQLKLLTTYI